MITLELDIKKNIINLKEEVLLNVFLSKKPDEIKKLIESKRFGYKVSSSFFDIVNNFIDFDDDGTSKYAGLIVRTNLEDYVVLYLDGTSPDEDYMNSLIEEYIKDIGNFKPKKTNVIKIALKNKDIFRYFKKL